MSRWEAATFLIRRDPGYWGGQLSHAGVGLLAIGLAFLGNLGAHTAVTVSPGDTVEFAGYSVTYEAPFVRTEPNRRVEGVTLDVRREGEPVTVLEPSVNRYPGAAEAILTPAVHTTPTGDLYATLVSSIEDETVRIELDTSPLVALVWTGGILAAAGGAFALRRRVRPVGPDRRPVRVGSADDAR